MIGNKSDSHLLVLTGEEMDHGQSFSSFFCRVFSVAFKDNEGGEAKAPSLVA